VRTAVRAGTSLSTFPKTSFAHIRTFQYTLTEGNSFTYINRLEIAEQVLAQLPKWFEDYNEIRLHQGLKMRSPREYRKSLAAESGCPV